MTKPVEANRGIMILSGSAITGGLFFPPWIDEMIRQQTALRDLALSPAARPDNHGMSHGGRFAMNEIWKRIPGYDDYEVSNLGKIKSYKKKPPHIMGVYFDNWGYQKIKLYKDGKYKNFVTGECVLLAFRGERPPKFEMSHIDGDKTNNKIDNLIYESRLDNEKRKEDHGTKVVGEKHPAHKLTAVQVLEIRELIKTGLSTHAIGIKYGVSSGCISSVASGKTWKYLSSFEKMTGKKP